VFSQAAYAYYYSGLAGADEVKNEYGLTNWTIDGTLSDGSSVVFVDNKDKDVVIAYRGTDPRNVKDLYTDFQIAIGSYKTITPARFQAAMAKYEKVKAKYGGDNIVVTGHSLGSTQSMVVAARTGARGHHFNPGGSFRDVAGGLHDKVFCASALCKNASQQVIYSTGRDPLSYAHLFGKVKVVKVTPKPGTDILAHGLDNFLPSKQRRVEVTTTSRQAHKRVSWKPDNFCKFNPTSSRCQHLTRQTQAV